MNGYPALVKQVHDRAYEDLHLDTDRAAGIVREAIGQLPELRAGGELDAASVEQFTALLAAPGPPPLPVRYPVSELNLAAARTLDDADVTRAAALARARICLQIAVELDPKRDAAAVRRLAGHALELATEFDLEAREPQLVAELHLQAGNPDMSAPSPTDVPIPRGLAHFLAAHRIKRALGDADLPRLEQVMVDAARFLMTSIHLPLGDRSEIGERVARATEVFAAVGDAGALRSARLELLRVSLEAHDLETAEATAAALAADAGLDGDQRRELALSTADLRSQQIRPADALAALDRAAIADDDPRRRYAETIRGNALRLAGDLPAAEAVFASVAERVAAESAADPTDVGLRGAHAHALTHLGMLAVEQGRIGEGEARFAQVDALFADGFLLDIPRLEFLGLASRSLLLAGALEQARARLSAALELRTRLEREMGGAAARERFLVTWAALDERQAALLLRAGDGAAALAAIEDAKSRVLRQLARTRAPGRLAPDAADERLRLGWARADADFRARRAELEAMGIGEAGRPALAAEVGRLGRHADALRALLERKAVEAIELVRPHEDPTTVAQDVAALTDGGAVSDGWSVVSYFGSVDGLGVCVCTGGEVDGVWLDSPTYAELRDGILDGLGRRRAALAAGKGTAAAWEATLATALNDLHGALIAPVEPILRRHETRRLLVVPHRALHSVPFGALADARSGAAVIDSYEAVAVVPGVRLAADVMRRARPPAGGRVVALAAPDAAAPLTAAEARGVIAAWGDDDGALLVGADAHSAALFGAAPGARVLHLACHGTWDPTAPGRSGLRLAPDPPGAPPLFGSSGGLVNPAALLTQLDLSACRVAVLSACDTGLARASTADEPISLPLVLMLAGSRATVASLWPVRDDSTLLLMGALHAALRAGTPPADALAGAQRELRSMPAGVAAGKLDRARAGLGGAGLDARVRERAERILDDAIERATGAAGAPYAHPDHWAAFACTGAPAAAHQEVPDR